MNTLAVGFKKCGFTPYDILAIFAWVFLLFYCAAARANFFLR